jgi:drug/metabolite transporter (DMT)-like permease
MTHADTTNRPKPAYYALIIFGVWTCSTAIIFIRQSTLHPILIVAMRLLIGATILFPFYLRDHLRSGERFTFAKMRSSVLPGIMLALHFITWVIGARMAQPAQASLIVNLVPLVMPFLLYFVTKERLHRAEWIATGMALVGLGILGYGDFHLDRETFLGDAICFGSMLLFSVYLILSRKNREKGGIFEYVVPLYYVAGICCLVPALLIPGALDGIDVPREWVIAFLLALLPTAFGHTILNFSMRKLRGQTVSIFNSGQFIFAGTMAYFVEKIKPGFGFYPAAVLLLAGAIMSMRAK